MGLRRCEPAIHPGRPVLDGDQRPDLGQHYIVEAYTNDTGLGSQFSVVGTVDGTNVTIVPSETVGSHPAGTPYTVQLNQGQTYQLNDADVPNGDLTGTDVTSDKPVAVFGGNNCADVPSGYFYCNILTEELVQTRQALERVRKSAS